LIGDGTAWPAAATARLARVRPKQTVQRYDKWVAHWLTWCAEQRFDVLSYSLGKWHLFAGWLESKTEDRDLNQVRSALNRLFDDDQQGRPFVGADVKAVIVDWAATKDAEKRARGEEVGLNRVPMNEAAVRQVFEIGLRASGLSLGKAAILITNMLSWARAASMAGLREGDAAFDRHGTFVVLLRFVKLRKEFVDNPGEIRVLPPTEQQRAEAARRGRRHYRDVAFSILRRANMFCPGWQTLVADRCTPSERGGDVAAKLVTSWMREFCGADVMNVADGQTVSAHSIREMAAVTNYQSGGSEAAGCQRGFWKAPTTMWTNYVKPYLHWPRSEVLAELYDDIPRK